jgi:hypothetical protein
LTNAKHDKATSIGTESAFTERELAKRGAKDLAASVREGAVGSLEENSNI